MRIGIYGGTFNPPHLGHVTAARAVIETLRLDRLFFIPSCIPPHKELPADSATAQQRLEMTRLAGEQLGMGDRVQVLDLELVRGEKSYTVDTLEELHRLYPEDELWLLMGTDMFLTLHNWYAAGRILELAGIAAFGRTEADNEAQFAEQRQNLYETFPQARLFTMTVPGVVDISSTALRGLLAEGKGGHLLAPAVYGYVLRHGLYRVNADLTQLSFPQLRAVALSYLNHNRIAHVLGTEQAAVRLAQRYGADADLLGRAALLHDCTKNRSGEEHLALCRQYDIAIDDLERDTPKLLHAKTGAAIARAVFGVNDVLYNAIYYHTTGRANMSLEEKILYLADYIEPTRDFPGVQELRRVCDEDLDRGLLMGLEMTIQDMNERGNVVHKATLEARDWLKGLI